MDDQAEGVQKRRSLAREGIQLRINLYREVWRELSRCFDDVKDEARIRAIVTGESIPSTDTSRGSRGFSTIVAWFVGLSDEDRNLVWAQGSDRMRDCDAQKAGYLGKLPFARNTDSVFAVSDESPTSAGAPPQRISHPGREPRRNGGRKPRKQG